jgi:hypothetical protein
VQKVLLLDDLRHMPEHSSITAFDRAFSQLAEITLEAMETRKL